MNGASLTVCFEDPFWIALVEIEDGGSYRVARHVFGAEPSDAQVQEFVADRWGSLRFTDPRPVAGLDAAGLDAAGPSAAALDAAGGSERRATGRTGVNPKRMKRLVEREVASNARRGTKAQQAIAAQYEADKQERKAALKERREEQRDRQYELRKQKSKEKHRGH